MDDTFAVKSKVPVHLWIVGVLSLLWNAFGAVDFTLTNIRYQPYLAGLPPEVIQQIDAYPAWSVVAWAFGVWGALAGSLLLLLRSRFAVHAFALSLAGLAATTLYQLAIGIYGFTGAMAVMNLAIWAIAAGLLVYAVKIKRRGVLG
jgi:hypothetical protein